MPIESPPLSYTVNVYVPAGITVLSSKPPLTVFVIVILPDFVLTGVVWLNDTSSSRFPTVKSPADVLTALNMNLVRYWSSGTVYVPEYSCQPSESEVMSHIVWRWMRRWRHPCR
ncbi:MAG: hypothetical protein LUH45_05425 [Clostridiales bacterium]|nr:hypothetical protein [Clostridiales bacterium]